MDKLRIENAFSQFDSSYHELKTVISAITWIMSAECAHPMPDSLHNAEAFCVVLGLSNLAERMMEESLFEAGVNQKRVALESVATEGA